MEDKADLSTSCPGSARFNFWETFTRERTDPHLHTWRDRVLSLLVSMLEKGRVQCLSNSNSELGGLWDRGTLPGTWAGAEAGGSIPQGAIGHRTWSPESMILSPDLVPCVCTCVCICAYVYVCGTDHLSLSDLHHCFMH